MADKKKKKRNFAEIILIISALVLGLLIILLVAGNKKKIIILADILIAISTLILAIFLQINNLANTSLIAIVVVSIIRSIGTEIQTPTVNSMIPLLVPKDKLMKFNGINSSIQSVIQFASPLVAGGILVLGSISNILFIDVITAVIGVSILSFIKIE